MVTCSYEKLSKKLQHPFARLHSRYIQSTTILGGFSKRLSSGFECRRVLSTILEKCQMLSLKLISCALYERLMTGRLYALFSY